MNWAAATIGLALAIACGIAPAVAAAGSIRATVDGDRKIVAVGAIERDTRGTDGVVSRAHAGRIEGRQIVIDQLPDQGSFDLRLETADGLIAGWNASVPPSDDEPPSPMTADHKRELLEKIATMSRRAFPHEVVVLDIQGNAQHAAILTTSVRRGGIQGVGAVGGWVWRADRYEYENPDDDTWAPLQEQPFYAVDRREVSPQQYAQLRVTYVAALGGIRLTADKPAVDLGHVVLPAASPGVHAAAADGRPMREFTVKPQPAEWPTIE
ncbi:MAG TPA: hypothetical protein VHY91_00305 [Pirellulales bacterium]|jgi:hypothetical protein|nr:hypothetical protein [Pirellulales bacterium]